MALFQALTEDTECKTTYKLCPPTSKVITSQLFKRGKLFHLNVHPQLQVGENCSYLFSIYDQIYANFGNFNTHFAPNELNNSD